MSLLSRLLGRSSPSVTSAAWIDAAELVSRLGDTASLPLVLDVRGPDEFTGPLGHIEGARNLPLPELGARIGEIVGLRRSVVCVCKTDRRSAAAADQLLAAGANNVSVLRGGMESWRRLGLPIG
jgi:rhodanese-related sulfurtransferase